MKIWIKICGITSVKDALMVEQAGADALGLIFVPHSKRYMEIPQAAQISAALGPFITRVGVFADAPLEDVIHTVKEVGLDIVQLYSPRDASYVAAIKQHTRVLPALRLNTTDALDTAHKLGANEAVLVDGAVPGSGESFDWDASLSLRELPRLILAGGLNPNNVQTAIQTLKPYGVDLASGVEASPGVKDATKVQDFVMAVRELTVS